MGETAYDNLVIEHAGPVARVSLNRPDIHNAFNEIVIREITDAFEELGARDEVRAIVLTGKGKSFCAGADLNWMRAMAGYDRETNLRDAQALARMLTVVDRCPKAVVARVNGAAFGGACGLVACCDVTIASGKAIFAFSEVNLGLVPATIAPFVVQRMGPASARRYFVTGERFDAIEARRAGLIDIVAQPDDLDAAVDGIIQNVLTSAPGGVATAKVLVREVTQRAFPAVNEYTARLIASVRSGPEAQEGMRAFLEKRRPPWVADS